MHFLEEADSNDPDLALRVNHGSAEVHQGH